MKPVERLSSSDRQMVEDITRAVLERVAPEELPLLRPTADAYWQGDRPQRGGADRVLGMGLGETNLMIYLVLPAAANVVAELLVPPVRFGLRRFVDWLRRRSNPPRVAGPAPHHIRASVAEAAARYSLSPELATAIAEIIIQRISGAKSGPRQELRQHAS